MPLNHGVVISSDHQADLIRKQMRKCAHRRNVILAIIKAHYNTVKTRPSSIFLIIIALEHFIEFK